MELVAKVPPVTNAGRYPKTDFYVDLDAGEVTCPAGEVTTAATPSRDHKGRPGLLFRFDPAECATCPLRADCTTAGRRADRLCRDPPPSHRRRPGRPARPPDPDPAAQPVQGGTQDRPSPGSGHAQSPLPRATQNQTSRPSWPPPSPTSVASTSSAPSANPPPPPWPPDPQRFPGRTSTQPPHRRTQTLTGPTRAPAAADTVPPATGLHASPESR